MSYTFNKSPDYNSSDKINVDIRIEEDDVSIETMFTQFNMFLLASGYSQADIDNHIWNLADKIEDEVTIKVPPKYSYSDL
jgi:hypothetical protein